VKPRPHTHTRRGLRFLPQYHISYKWNYYSAPIIYKYLLKVLCPVSRPITTLECVLLKDNNLVLVARTGPEINSQACLCVLQGTRHNNKCWFSIQRFIFLLKFCLETPKKSSGPSNPGSELFLASLSAISFPRIPAPTVPNGPQSRSGHFGYETKLLPLSAIEPGSLGRPAHGLATTPTAL
jgi:hypothetical protein